MKTKHVEIKDVFSSAAKYAFKKKGRKQKDVAAEVGMSISSANDYINGRREGDEGTRTRIAEALGYSYRDFMAIGRHILEGGDHETWRPMSGSASFSLGGGVAVEAEGFEQAGMTVDEIKKAEQDVIATLRALKIIEWLTDEMENYTLPKAIDQITSTSRFSAWIKKKQGRDKNVVIQLETWKQSRQVRTNS